MQAFVAVGSIVGATVGASYVTALRQCKQAQLRSLYEDAKHFFRSQPLEELKLQKIFPDIQWSI